MLVATVLGACGTTLLRLMLSLADSPVLMHVLAVLPQGLAGGRVLALASCYYAITKNTDIRLLRALRFYLLDVASLIGKAVGWLLGWFIHKFLGYKVTLCAALIVQALTLVLVGKDTSPAGTTTSDNAVAKIRTLFSADNARQAMKVFDRDRHKDIKGTLQILFVLMAILSVMNYGPRLSLQIIRKTLQGTR
ncbi:hypothetical protein IscW_ISCW010391 [Ixodes scapularis]|uniref:Uncharacterized protein n=1 Tax=Ixodes scapularis TaxID=6945 RepID=B7Q5F4_IXOSC|nr:hypothetical protein IscW_ISCW010391 [Ixodes scapularis]|eukprot:XP_002401920.1 hypothetical protein IscW_ISCW010391 [Ixodes scapularis]